MSDNKVVHSNNNSTLADVLDRILDKGIVIAGDISISIAEIELISIKIRLVVASLDKAAEMGIDWWKNDPFLSSTAQKNLGKREVKRLEAENEPLVDRFGKTEEKSMI